MKQPKKQREAHDKLRELGYKQKDSSKNGDSLYHIWVHTELPTVILQTYRSALYGMDAGYELFVQLKDGFGDLESTMLGPKCNS